ncbi:MAG: universal stress protein [Desulfuromonadales bacterium]|nr:universal stress protein [Desulfuromonadales bacterium]NIR34082.1 universal stress protein [Desulfuromonadales bacterium]NIS40181.1 universal stress protein [Desulfuromonadales bacterium]
MLPNYKNILIATDLTENSEHAFKHAVLLARKSKANIHLLHVVPEIDAGFRSYISAVMGEGKLEELQMQNEKQALDEIKRELKEFTRKELENFPEDQKNIAGIEVYLGDPVAKILQVADTITADVIVMGTHGKGAIEHAFLGSVAEKVLRKSKRPVFVIPIP